MSAHKEFTYGIFKSAIDVFEDKPKLLSWISQHPIISRLHKVQKVFPRFGLKNFRKKVEFLGPGISRPALDYAKEDLHQDIKDILHKVYEKLEDVSNKFGKNKNTEYLENFRIRLTDLKNLIMDLDSAIRNKYDWQLDKDGKFKYLLTNDVSFDYKKVFFKGQSIFRAYNKLKDLLANELPLLSRVHSLSHNTFAPLGMMPPLESLQSFKEFSKLNIPISKDFYVVFSSENEGAWDLATMSMRGIRSCQSWTGNLKECIIGSIVSRFVGIIYLTTGSKTEHGESMMIRCLVRFGIDITQQKPVIIIDKMWPDYNKDVSDLFEQALKEKSVIPVLNFSSHSSEYSTNLPDKDVEEIEIPYEPYTEELEKHELSYQDINFPLRRIPTQKTLKEEIPTDIPSHFQKKYMGLYISGWLKSFNLPLLHRIQSEIQTNTPAQDRDSRAFEEIVHQMLININSFLIWQYLSNLINLPSLYILQKRFFYGLVIGSEKFKDKLRDQIIKSKYDIDLGFLPGTDIRKKQELFMMIFNKYWENIYDIVWDEIRNRAKEKLSELKKM